MHSLAGLAGGIATDAGTIGQTVGAGGNTVIDTAPGPGTPGAGAGNFFSALESRFPGFTADGVGQADIGSLLSGQDAGLLGFLQGNGIDPNAFAQARQALLAQLQQMGIDLSGANPGLLNMLALRMVGGGTGAGAAGNPQGQLMGA
jgi:hypothetical protein